MTYSNHYDNILDSKCDVLVNPVNCEGVAGKGLALQFRTKYPKEMSRYKQECKAGILTPGNCILIQIDNMKQYICCFPTKDRWKDISHLSYIDVGLQSLYSLIYDKIDIKSIAIPALGCGLGGLSWNSVSELIFMFYWNFGREIQIDVYPPKEYQK